MMHNILAITLICLAAVTTVTVAAHFGTMRTYAYECAQGCLP